MGCFKWAVVTLVNAMSLYESIHRHKYKYYSSVYIHCREVALRTEGYQPGDLETLVERAISHAELRTLDPRRSLSLKSLTFDSELPPESPRLQKRGNNVTTPEKEFLGGIDIPGRKNSNSSVFAQGSSPSLVTTPSATTPTQRMLLADQGGVSYGREDSSQTVIPYSPVLRTTRSLSDMRLALKDFFAALEGFTPVSLRGLPLHSAGSVDFSHIGGLDAVKDTLRETLLWPSKVPYQQVNQLHDSCTH